MRDLEPSEGAEMSASTEKVFFVRNMSAGLKTIRRSAEDKANRPRWCGRIGIGPVWLSLGLGLVNLLMLRLVTCPCLSVKGQQLIIIVKG